VCICQSAAIKINVGDSGTVNPSIVPLYDGRFAVSYVNSSSGGGDLNLAWLDPTTCQVTEGPIVVNDIPGGVYYWGGYALAADLAGNYYAVWEATSELGEVTFAASTNGFNFGPEIEAVSVSDNGRAPAMLVLAQGHVAVAWTGFINSSAPAGFEYDPFLTTNPSALGSGVFSAAVQVAETAIQDDQVALAHDAEGGIYVAWESFPDGSPQGGNIYVAKSTNVGQAFGTPVQVNDVDTKASVGHSRFMAFGNGKLYVVWSDSRDDYEGDVYIDVATPDLDFGPDVRVNDDTNRYQEDPCVAVGSGGTCDGEVFVVWQDFRSNQDYDVYAARSADGNLAFGSNKLVSVPSEGDDMNPELGVNSDCVVAVTWRDENTSGSWDVQATFVVEW